MVEMKVLGHNRHMSENFGAYLVELRRARDLSANRVALSSGVDQGTLSKVERGERRATDEMLAKLAPVLGVPFMTLKQAALRDRLSQEDIQAVAEIAAEDAQPKDIIRQVKVHFRSKDIPAAERAEYLKELAELIKAADDNWDEL